MKYLDPFLDIVRSRIGGLTGRFRRRFLGANNETLDFLMDSFNRLAPEQRAAVIVGSGAAAIFLSLGVMWFYFASVDALEKELNRSFNSLHELRALKREYEAESERYTRLLSTIGRKTTGERVKPFFEEKAQALGVELQGLNDSKISMPVDNPLSQKMQYVKVDVRLPKISIPRLLSFLTEVEKSNNYLSVEDLVIRGRYGTRLYFDAEAKFRGYNVEGL